MVRSRCTIQQACHGEHRRWKMRRIEACSIKSHSASSPWLDLSTTEQVWESVSLQCIAFSQHHLTASQWHCIVLEEGVVKLCAAGYICAVWSVQCAVQQDEIDWSGTLSLSRQATNALEHHSRWWWWLSENITFINYDYQINVIGSSCPQREYLFKTLINYLMFYRIIIVLCCWNMNHVNHGLQSSVEISI